MNFLATQVNEAEKIVGGLERAEAELSLEASVKKPKRSLQLISQNSVKRRVAVIDDDDGIRAYLEDVLSQQDFTVQPYASAEAFLSDLDRHHHESQDFVDVVLCDVRLPGLDGLAFVSGLKSRSWEVPIILMTAYAEVQAAVQAMREGAYDYLEKPFDSARLSSVLENALRFRRLSHENSFLKHFIDAEIKLPGVPCQSPAMRAVYEMVKRVAPTDSGVLLTGERGVGKKVIARAIHDNSHRAGKPFVVVDCSAIPESLLEAELFGHSRQSHVGLGSRVHRRGFFEEAEGGTLLMDEISELSPALQAKLLRFFQEQKIRAVGEVDFFSTDVRVLASTSKNLEAEISAGRFREDLFYRLGVIPLHLAPLRQRKEDVVLLARHFLGRTAAKNKLGVRGFTQVALEKLVQLPWKGNVWELQNVVEQSAILCTGEQVEESDIPVGAAEGDDLWGEVSEGMPPLRDLERRYILSVLKRHNGKKDVAAKVLGMSRRTLYRKIEGQDLEEETFH